MKSRRGLALEQTGSLFSNEHAIRNKVPQVTLFFWLIKMMSTTVGETAADFLNFNLNWGLTNTTLVMSGLLLISLYVQVSAKKYVPALYWLAVVLISVVGTLISDNLADNLGVPLELSTVLFASALLVTFVVWYKSERTLSIHSITTRRREAFYWLTILFTFALGTSAGDLVAESLNLGYFVSALIFAAVIGAVALAHYRFKLNAVTAFWLAYILTRPLGASLGDYLSQPRSEGGLELGTTSTSVTFVVIICGLVVYLTKTKKDQFVL
ncbi:membrane protein [Paenibacillus stellifer]|uniref:Membrane protein n=1 Tax=Paenibacillus stellifer TaxID=169760 RepID=A0A089LTV1_9BACL|nr:membrane protein [Paenibacillus stellifer]